jgi:hypothetical protein
MGCLHQAGQFVRLNHCDRPLAPVSNDEDFAIIRDAIE